MTPTASIGVNLRVTGHCSQGGRKYMEDFFSVAYQQSEDEKDLEYAFFGIYDGHGGSEAATYAKEHLMNAIVNQKLFWSDYDQDILRAIREGYIATHYAMWREQEKWPKTATGLPSTAGTTASVAFIRRGKIYIGHVGDSGIVLGYQEEGEKCWRSKPLTHDHKPECNVEKARIINSGGKVVTKSGVPRVVWNRPRIGHKGPVRRSTPIDEIPFLAVARSLGDLWSYNSALNEFVVSPDPDVKVVKIDPKTFRCLIFGTDGLWNVISPSDAVDLARDTEVINEKLSYMNGSIGGGTEWTNPSKCLVDKALERWCARKMRADNTSVVTIMLDPPGPPKREVIRNCSTAATYSLDYIQLDGLNGQINSEYSDIGLMENFPALDNSTVAMYDSSILDETSIVDNNYTVPTNGYAIMTRYESNCDNNIMYYENCSSNDVMMSSSNSNLLNSQSSIQFTKSTNSNNSSAVIDNPSSSLASSSCQITDIQYMNSFAESYNSLLISNYEDDDVTVEDDTDKVLIGSEGDVREYHTYQSLDESGIIGQDHIHHHQPQSIHQHQQHLYQQQCMSDEDGYSLTKLETRCEQQFRQNDDYKEDHSNQQQLPEQQESNTTSANKLLTFQEFNKTPQNNHYNQYNNVTSSYQQTMTTMSPTTSTTTTTTTNANTNYTTSMTNQNNEPNNQENNLIISQTVIQNTNECEEFEEVNDNNEKDKLYDKNSIKPVTKQNFANIDNISIEKDANTDNRLFLDESIQINEISSSVIEPVICCIEDHNEKSSSLLCLDVEMKSPSEINNCDDDDNDVQKTPRTTRRSVKNLNRKSKNQKIDLIEQNENISILEPRKLRSTVNCNKRNLRSRDRDNLPKDIKTKATATVNKKQVQQQQQLRRNVNNYLKVSNSSATSSNVTSSIRTRQFQVQLQREHQQSVNILSSRQTRSKNSPTVRRTAADSSLQKSSNNSNLRNKPKIQSDLVNCISSTSSTSSSSSSSSFVLSSVSSSSSSSLIVSSSTTMMTTLPSSKRSFTSRNSAWCSGSKSSVQTRNRVQKRLSH